LLAYLSNLYLESGTIKTQSQQPLSEKYNDLKIQSFHKNNQIQKALQY
jgi:hypothetical protein